MVELDWKDPQAILDVIIADPKGVTPLMLERLLEHFDFEHVCDLPTATKATCALWAPRARHKFMQLGQLQVTIYHSEPVTPTRLRFVIFAIRSAVAVYKGCGIGAPTVTFGPA